MKQFHLRNVLTGVAAHRPDAEYILYPNFQ